jgi:hypothetical protein
VVLFIRIGRMLLEFEKGKNRVLAGSMERLATVIDTLIEAVRAGELDSALAQAKSTPLIAEGLTIISQSPIPKDAAHMPELRVSFSGRTAAFHAGGRGSIPLARSIKAYPRSSPARAPISLPRRGADKRQPSGSRRRTITPGSGRSSFSLVASSAERA